MKRKLLWSNYLLIFTLLSVAFIAMLSTACGGDEKITVLNPAVTEALADRTPLAPRLDKLEGKTVYLVDMNYEGIGGTPVMREMQTWFTRNMPDVKAVYRLKKGNYITDDPELWKEITEEGGDAVIMGVAG
ncbi:MAG: hypothetical protein P8Z37_17905 [Acidobacteriota bacterium]|jgi:hypothetical protein